MSQKNWIIVLGSILGVMVLGGAGFLIYNAGLSSNKSSSSSVAILSLSSSSKNLSSVSSGTILSSSSSSAVSSSITSSSASSSASRANSSSSSSSAPAVTKYVDPELPGFSIDLVDGWKLDTRSNSKIVCSITGGPVECDNFNYTFVNATGAKVSMYLGKPPEWNLTPRMEECISIGNTWNRCRPRATDNDQNQRYFIVDQANVANSQGDIYGVMFSSTVKNMLNTKANIVQIILTNFGSTGDRAIADSFINTMIF
jgi:hypothetical protein